MEQGRDGAGAGATAGTVAGTATVRDQSRPLGYSQRRKRDASLLTVQAALKALHAADEAVRQLCSLRLTADGVRDRAADVAEALDLAERELLRAIVVLQSMDDKAPVDMAAILGRGE